MFTYCAIAAVMAIAIVLLVMPWFLPFLKKLMAVAQCPLLLAADALNLIAKHPAFLHELGTATVITPHEGEMKRLEAALGLNSGRGRVERIGLRGQAPRGVAPRAELTRRDAVGAVRPHKGAPVPQKIRMQRNTLVGGNFRQNAVEILRMALRGGKRLLPPRGSPEKIRKRRRPPETNPSLLLGGDGHAVRRAMAEVAPDRRV